MKTNLDMSGRCLKCGCDHRPPPPGPTPVIFTHTPIFGPVTYTESAPEGGEVPRGTANAAYQAVVAHHLAMEERRCASRSLARLGGLPDTTAVFGG